MAPARLLITTADKGAGIVCLEVGQETILKTNHHLTFTHVIHTGMAVYEVRTQGTAINTDATIEHFITNLLRIS